MLQKYQGQGLINNSIISFPEKNQKRVLYYTLHLDNRILKDLPEIHINLYAPLWENHSSQNLESWFIDSLGKYLQNF